MITSTIVTKDRENGLYGALLSVLQQTVKPNEVIIYDDSLRPKHKDIWKIESFAYLKSLSELYGVDIRYYKTNDVGQTINHQRSLNDARYQYIWRLDDDEVANADVLEKLYNCIILGKRAAVGGLVIQPDQTGVTNVRKQTIADTESHTQMYLHQVNKPFEVQHLHSTFLFDKTKTDGYPDLILDKIGVREETIFTYEMFRKGYSLWVVPDCITWHFRSKKGGMRSQNPEGYTFNNNVLNHKKNLWAMINPNTDLLIMDQNGIGDSIVLESVLKDITKKYHNGTVWVCTPNIEVFKMSPQQFLNVKFLTEEDGRIYFNGRLPESIYGFMAKKEWKKSMADAYKEFYNV